MTSFCKTIYDEEKKVWNGPPENYDLTRPVGEVMLGHLRRRGDKVLQIYHDTKEQMTANELYEKTVKLTVQLRHAGIKQGDIVTVNVRNVPNSTPVLLALFCVGAVINILDHNNLTNPKNDNGLLKKIVPKFVICHAAAIDAIQSHLTTAELDAEIITIDENQTGLRCIENMLSSEEEDSEFIPPVIEDTQQTIGLILASSGTTGAPKAICLSHAMVLGQILRCTVIVDWGVIYNPSPLDWISGIDCLLGSIVRGKVRIISTAPMTPQLIVDIVLEHQVTDAFADPSRIFAIHQILSERKIQLPTVRLLVCSGTLVSEDLRKTITHCFPNATVAVAYGLTEIGGLGTASMLGHRGHSVGFLIRGIQVQLLNKEGERIGPNEVGEIFLKAGSPFMGYYGDEAATKAKRSDDGWLCTDDMGYFDDDGYMYIVSRKQDLLQYLNHVINPVDIESVIEKHPGVMRACVVAVSVPIYNDIPAAVCVKSKDSTVTAEELHSWVEDKVPDNHKLRGGIYFIDAMPVTATGKIRKIECKGLAFKEYHEKKFKIKSAS